MNAIAAIPSITTAFASLDYPAFKNAVLNACKVIERRSTDLVLTTMLIRSGRNGVSVIGTDLDIYTTTSVPGMASPGFSALVDAHKLKSMMDKVKDAATITFSENDDGLSVSIGKLSVRLQRPAEIADFPLAQTFRTKLAQSNCSFMLPSAKLAAILAKISFAISTEETRYYLNGIYMHVDASGERLAFACTDGHRAAVYAVPATAGAEAMPERGVIIPRKTIAELARLVGRKGCPEATMVSVTETGVSFLVGDDELIESKVIDGTFPDYGRVFPTSNPNRVGVSTAGLVDAIKQASAVLDRGEKAVALDFTKDRLTVRCTSKGFGTASTSVPISRGFDLTIGFNGGYLLDIFERLDGGAMLELGDEGSPALIRDGADPSVTFVQMPMRV